MVNGAQSRDIGAGDQPEASTQLRMLNVSDRDSVLHERVRNVTGENHDSKPAVTPTQEFNSWRDYWQRKSGIPWPDYCPVQNTLFKTQAANAFKVRPCNERIGDTENGVGGRVQQLDEFDEAVDSTTYVMPLCRWHGSEQRNGAVFQVDKKLLVQAPLPTPLGI